MKEVLLARLQPYTKEVLLARMQSYMEGLAHKAATTRTAVVYMLDTNYTLLIMCCLCLSLYFQIVM